MTPNNALEADPDTMAGNGKKRLIVVLGMHRSGTSAITRGMQVMGVDLGDNLMPAVEDVNEKGFWEDLDIYALNNELLDVLGSDWHYLAPIKPAEVEALRESSYITKAAALLFRKAEKTNVFGFKDPRVAKLLPFWKEVFIHCQFDTSYVLVVRHPLSVAKSLAKRDGLDAEKSYFLWLGHIIESLAGIAGKRCVLVDYDKLMQSPEFQISWIAERLNLRVDPVELESYITQFLDKTLQHTAYDLNDLSLDDTCPLLVREIYTELLGAASNKITLDDPLLKNKIEQWVKEWERIKPILTLVDRFSTKNARGSQNLLEGVEETANPSQSVAELDRQIVNLEQTLIERDRRIANLDLALIERNNEISNINQARSEISARLTAIENSTLWKMTFHLRRTLAHAPVLRKTGRRTIKLVWWMSTFQLGKRLRKWKAWDIPRLEAPHFAPPTDDYCLAIPLSYPIKQWESAPHLAVIFHMYYTEMAEEFQRYLVNIPFPFDLFITTDSQEKCSEIENRFCAWNRGKLEIRITPNRGRDIAPKLISCRDLYDKYEFVLHIHTKKSPHADVLSGWRTYLLETLLGSENIVASVFESFRSDPALGIVAPQHFEPVWDSIGWGWNFEKAREFACELGIKIPLDGRIDFPSGSMFWARSAALKPLLDCNLSIDQFPNESNQIDGTLGHIIERLYFFVCERAGYRWIKIGQASLIERTERVKYVQNRKELVSFIKRRQYRLLKSRKLELLRSLFPSSIYSPTSKKVELERLAYEKSGYQMINLAQFKHEVGLHIDKKESLIDFDEEFYLTANSDVAASVAQGTFSCGFMHYCLKGQDEGRIWSDNQLKRRFSLSPSFPDGFNAPIHIRPLPKSDIDLSRLPPSSKQFLLIFFSHLQSDLFFAGYTAFFQDFKPLFGKFSKVVLSVENREYSPHLAKRYSDRIEVIQERELTTLECQPDLIIAFNSRLFIKAQQIFNNPNRTIYYCQDFESGFFPYGAEYVEAEKAIASSQNIIVSTELLRSFFVDKQLLRAQRAFTTSPKIEPFDVPKEKTKRLFFYFRPEAFHPRNLPQTIVEAVENFCRKHVGYEMFLVGSVDTRYSYKINGTPVYVINKLPRKDYIQLISSCDVVVSMIYSAHPGVIAFQSAASGIPTITNVFENRDANLLKQISENILPYDPIREDLLEIIEVALTMPKGKKSFNEGLYSGHGTQSLSDFIDIILSESAATNGSEVPEFYTDSPFCFPN